MFRCITELKGIAVDIDSFQNPDIQDWIEVNEIVPCIFLTTKDDTIVAFREVFGIDKVIQLKKFERMFSPNKSTHIKVLKALGIENTELAYLARNHIILENANGFLSGTIWITDEVSYQQASKAPDIILNSICDLKEALKENFNGFFGEMVVFPKSNSLASMLPVSFFVDDDEIPMYILGRYFGYSHYMNHLHPYSTSILLNKKIDKPYYGVFDKTFGKIYATAIKELKKSYTIDCVCSVPIKPNKDSRFDAILETISNGCNLANVGTNFKCIREYPDQKSLSMEEREQNVKGAFRYEGNLNGYTVVLIDDIISTGATIKECVRELKRKGAAEIIVVGLAINQFDTGTYWSAETPQVSCPECGSKMDLRINRNGQFFYGCHDCYNYYGTSVNLDFSTGWDLLVKNENEKFHAWISEKTGTRVENDYEFDGNINFEREIKCPYCHCGIQFNLRDITNVLSYERQMGTENLYEFDDEILCDNCENTFYIDGYISEYPLGCFDSEHINIKKEKED